MSEKGGLVIHSRPAKRIYYVATGLVEPRDDLEKRIVISFFASIFGSKGAQEHMKDVFNHDLAKFDKEDWQEWFPECLSVVTWLYHNRLGDVSLRLERWVDELREKRHADEG